MSPVLGPGKVTWSTCSNRELSQFISSHPQAVCLDDKHQPLPQYDYLKDGTSPGEKYNALAQCQLSFGDNFKPHLRDEVPFEVRDHSFFVILCPPEGSHVCLPPHIINDIAWQ